MVDNDYVGDAPITVTLRRHGVYERYALEAYPPKTGNGLFVQRKSIEQGAAIPKRMLFDLRLGPAVPRQQIDADIKIEKK